MGSNPSKDTRDDQKLEDIKSQDVEIKMQIREIQSLFK